MSGVTISRGYSTKRNKEWYPIPSVEECVARARAEFLDDPVMLRMIARQIDRFQEGVAMEEDGARRSYRHNKEAWRLKSKCRNAPEELNIKGYNAECLPPRAAEVLALRYCSPYGAGDRAAYAMLMKLGCRHLSVAHPLGKDGAARLPVKGEPYGGQLAEILSDTRARMEELGIWMAEVCRDVKDIKEHIHAARDN